MDGTTSGGGGNSAAQQAGPALRADHARYLLDRAVPVDFAIAAGLRSVGADEGVTLLGLNRPAAGLALAYLDGTGATASWRIRLDDWSGDGPKVTRRVSKGGQ